MSSDLRSLTSAANGRHSKGPVTAEGKQKSSRNAIRHGLLSRCLVLADESPEAFQELLDDYIQRFKPADSVELRVVEEMTGSMWRVRRSWAVETSLLDRAAEAPDSPSDPLARIATAFGAGAQSPGLPLAHRYETRLHMIFQRALRTLLLIRAKVPIESPTELPNEPTFPEVPVASKNPE